MKTVKIYIETSFAGPVVKDGKYAAALVFTKGGQDFTRTVHGEENETTYNRCTLMAIIAQCLYKKHGRTGESGEVEKI